MSSFLNVSCRQLFKEMNILTLVSLHIMEVICYIRKHHHFVDLNSNTHAHDTRRKMDNHIQSYDTLLYKRSVINMGTKLYNKFPGYKKEIDSYKTFNPSAWGHLNPSSYCDVGRLFYGVFKLWSKLQRKKMKK